MSDTIKVDPWAVAEEIAELKREDCRLRAELDAALHARNMAQARCRQMEDQNLALRKQIDGRDKIIDAMIARTKNANA